MKLLSSRLDDFYEDSRVLMFLSLGFARVDPGAKKKPRSSNLSGVELKIGNFFGSISKLN